MTTANTKLMRNDKDAIQFIRWCTKSGVHNSVPVHSIIDKQTAAFMEEAGRQMSVDVMVCLLKDQESYKPGFWSPLDRKFPVANGEMKKAWVADAARDVDVMEDGKTYSFTVGVIVASIAKGNKISNEWFLMWMPRIADTK